MESGRFTALAEHASKFDFALHVESRTETQAASRRGEQELDIRDRVAVVSLDGTLMKHASSFSGGTSTVAARREIRKATASDKVGSILLKIDSPGGTVAGTKELADEVIRAGKSKPVATFFEHLCESRR